MKNTLDEMVRIEEYASQEDIARIKAELLTCPDINTSIAGTIIELSKNHAKSVLVTTNEMSVDDEGLVHDAFVFCAASYVAQASINKEFSVLIGSKSSFYAPLKVGDVVIFEAVALFDESSKKREVKVVGHSKEIKVFEASIQIVVTEDHIFRLKRPPSTTAKENTEEKDGKAAATSGASASTT